MDTHGIGAEAGAEEATLPDDPVSEKPPAMSTGITLRSVLLGLCLVAGIAWITPINDWQFHNTFFYGNYMPVGVTALIILLGLVVNPLLGRNRLRIGELSTILSLLLVLGGVVSSGLNRLLPAVIAGPAKLLPVDPGLAGYGRAPRDGQTGPTPIWALPHQMFLEMPRAGPILLNDPEYRWIIDGFFSGLQDGRGPALVTHRSVVTWTDADGATHTALALGGLVAAQGRVVRRSFLDLDDPASGMLMRGLKVGEIARTPQGTRTIRAISPPGIPWAAWSRPLLAWMPLLLASFLCCFGIAGVVRHQWIDHERLPFTIPNVMLHFLADPAPGARLAAIFRDRLFWIGVTVSGSVLVWHGLAEIGCLPIPMDTTIDLTGPFASFPWFRMFEWWYFFQLKIFFGVIGLVFFLSLDLSFSMWFCWVATNMVWMWIQQAGFSPPWSDVAEAGCGGFAVECLLILWIGRRHYLGVVKACLASHRDPEIRAAVPYCWALVLGSGGMFGVLVALGSPAWGALVMVLLFLGFCLVLARIVAEAGICFIGMPTGFGLNSVLFSIIGFDFPLAAMIPLSLIGAAMLAISREALLPFAVQAEYLGSRTGLPRWRMSSLMIVVVIAGLIISFASMLFLSYHHAGDPDPYWSSVLDGATLRPILQGFQAAHHGGASHGPPSPWVPYAVGAAIVAVLGICRLSFATFPLHPIGYLTSMTYATWNLGFSFFVGWLCKFLVMRYGGSGLYKRLRPMAIGLIAGEALVAGLFLVAMSMRHMLGLPDIPAPQILPG